MLPLKAPGCKWQAMQIPDNQPTPINPNTTARAQEEFLRCYTDKAQALAAEAEGFKGQKAEAHKSLGRARGKLSALERRLAEERGRKEVGAWGVCCVAVVGG